MRHDDAIRSPQKSGDVPEASEGQEQSDSLNSPCRVSQIPTLQEHAIALGSASEAGLSLGGLLEDSGTETSGLSSTFGHGPTLSMDFEARFDQTLSEGYGSLETSPRHAAAAAEPTETDETRSFEALRATHRQGTEPGSSMSLPERYEWRATLGAGAMGEVFRVFDRFLCRTVALKILRPDVVPTPLLVSRFVEEAQTTAQLQHPGIIPIHDAGQLPDGRTYFTMKEVQGKTLDALARAFHQASPPGTWGEVPASGASPALTFRSLIEIFLQVCRAVAYAHARGVIHRDLKPSNVMVGSFGEVLVLDWGVARVLAQPTDSFPSASSYESVVLQSHTDTAVGTITGTPAYMAPEQASGDPGLIGGWSDVYSLGVILFELLTGVLPIRETTLGRMLIRLLEGPTVSLVALLGKPAAPGVRLTATGGGRSSHALGGGHSGRHAYDSGGSPTQPGAPTSDPRIPRGLAEICDRARAHRPEDRYQNATEMLTNLQAWLEGADRTARAEELVTAVKGLPELVQTLRTEAASLEAQAVALLKSVPQWEVAQLRYPAYDLEDRARALNAEADLAEVEYVQALRGALTHDPELLDAHQRLADHFQHQHKRAEARKDLSLATQYQLLIGSHDRAGRHQAYLHWVGEVTLVTDPPNANVSLYRFEEVNRVLTPRFVRELGRTPLLKVGLEQGSWLLVIEAPGRIEVRYPVMVRRGEHWNGIRPGGSVPYPIYLPSIHELGVDDCYVPAGPVWVGGDPGAILTFPHTQFWVDGFVFRRFHVTNEEYLLFLNELLQQGREADALRYAPREMSGTYQQDGPLIFARDKRGRFALKVDSAGTMIQPRWPITMVNFDGARAYCRWYAQKTGNAWRLPGEFEHEKASRGVDERIFPWGNHLDCSRTIITGSFHEAPHPKSVDAAPGDESIYGIRCLSGLARTWCCDIDPQQDRAKSWQGVVPRPSLEGESARRIVRGGGWDGGVVSARGAFRAGDDAARRFASLGFRLARSVP